MSRRIARPYATALFEVLTGEGVDKLREVEAGLTTLAAAFAKESELVRVFEVPTVTPARKKELITSIVTAVGLRPEAARLVLVMTQHMRLRLLGEVAAVFRELVDRREGVVRGKVELPAQPSNEQLATLTQALSSQLRAPVRLESVVRPQLVAGFVVRLGSRVFDGSLAAQLQRFAAGADK